MRNSRIRKHKRFFASAEANECTLICAGLSSILLTREGAGGPRLLHFCKHSDITFTILNWMIARA